MAEIRYIPLIELRFHHAYFASGLCENLEVSVSDECNLALRNFRMLVKPMQAGLRILYEHRQTDEGLNPTIAVDRPLQFRIRFQNTDPYFYHYTDLPFAEDKKGRALYLTNAADDATFLPSGNLHQEEVLNEDNFAELKGKQFVYQASASDAKLVSVLDRNQETVFEAIIDDPEEIPADLSAELTGAFSINENHKAAGSFVTVNDPSRRHHGYLDLFYDPETMKDDLPYRYDVHFGARKVRWRYTVMKQKNGAKTFGVSDEAGALNFSDEGMVMQGSKERHSLLSESSIALHQSYDHHFQLVDAANGNPVLESLPYPNLTNFKVLDKSNREYLIEAYVMV